MVYLLSLILPPLTSPGKYANILSGIEGGVKLMQTLFSLTLQIVALELLLLEKGICTPADLKDFKTKAEEMDSQGRQALREAQWKKVTPGTTVKFCLTPQSSITLEVLGVSVCPFAFLAGKIIGKEGKSGYRVNELFSTHYCPSLEIITRFGANEIIRNT